MTAERQRRAAIAIVAVAGIAGLAALFYVSSRHFVAANSDGATVILEGASMQSGAPLLQGWSLSLDSFWSLDATVSAIGVALVGLRAGLLAAVPAALGVAVVGGCAALALRGRRGAAACASLAVVVAIIGLPSPTWSYFFLQGPWHVGTALVCLVAFGAISSRRAVAGTVIATVALALGLLGDLQTLALGVVPVACAGLVAMARDRRFAPGVLGLVAGAGSVALAVVTRLCLAALDAYGLVGANPTARFAEALHNLARIPDRVAGLLGVGTIPLNPHVPSSRVAPLHVVGLVLVLVGVGALAVTTVTGALSGRRPGTGEGGPVVLEDLVALGILGDLAAFCILASTGNGNYARYLVAGVAFATLGAALMAGHAVERAGRSGRAVGAASLLVVAAFGAACGIDLTRPSVTRPSLALASALESDGLTAGLGDYWSSSIVTVESGGRVAIRPVIADGKGVLRRYGRQSTSHWYAGQRFGFVVFDTSPPNYPWRGVDETSALRTFGAPARVISVGGYRVLVYPKGITISAVGYSNS